MNGSLSGCYRSLCRSLCIDGLLWLLCHRLRLYRSLGLRNCRSRLRSNGLGRSGLWLCYRCLRLRCRLNLGLSDRSLRLCDRLGNGLRCRLWCRLWCRCGLRCRLGSLTLDRRLLRTRLYRCLNRLWRWLSDRLRLRKLLLRDRLQLNCLGQTRCHIILRISLRRSRVTYATAAHRTYISDIRDLTLTPYTFHLNTLPIGQVLLAKNQERLSINPYLYILLQI